MLFKEILRRSRVGNYRDLDIVEIIIDSEALFEMRV